MTWGSRCGRYAVQLIRSNYNLPDRYLAMRVDGQGQWGVIASKRTRKAAEKACEQDRRARR